MTCGLFVGNSLVHIGTSSPSAGARLKQGGGDSVSCHHRHHHPLSTFQSDSRHAEMDALRYFRRHDVRKARIVVMRLVHKSVGSNITLTFGDSRPCFHCIQRIVRYHRNVRSVTYYQDGRWYTESPEECSKFSGLSLGERLKL